MFEIDKGFEIDRENLVHNPDDEWYKEFLKDYYVVTADGQYLFASKQPGRMPTRAFYVVPDNYRLGKKQQKFRYGTDVAKKYIEVIKEYLKTVPVIVVDGIQGEAGYEVGVRNVISIRNPHAGYIAWMGKQMIFPPKKDMKISCRNFIIEERLPDKYIKKIKGFFPEFQEDLPLTIYDFTEMDNDRRLVVNYLFDYFGAAFKKPNLTMVWNKGEADGLISYHAGCTNDRVLKGLSGTGKTTLTVGPTLEQDDACFGKPYYDNSGRIYKVQLIGLEAASFAKSEGLRPGSPEWPGLMRSREVDENGKRAVVLALNIDCEGVEYRTENIAGFEVRVPRKIPGEEIGSLQCTKYEKSATTNGRFIFLFSELNKNWGSTKPKWLKTESLSFKRYDIVEPIFRVIDPYMAAALDSACESIITSALSDLPVGSRVRSYAATDFMAREQSEQALLKLKMYRDMGLGLEGKLVFFINNAGYVGEFDINGKQIVKRDENGNPIVKINSETGKPETDGDGNIKYVGQGEKITVEDSKKLVDLVEHRKIRRWIRHPAYGYLIPDPEELEKLHGFRDFRKRFNLLRFYTPDEIVEFIKRDIEERTAYLKELFSGQRGEEKLEPVINVWTRCRIPTPKEIRKFYETHYGVL